MKLEKNPVNILMLMSHLQERGRFLVNPSTAKNLLFTVKMGTFRDGKLSRGDLGNQLFQLTACMAYAWRNNAAAIIEKPSHQNGIKLDCFQLENINIVENIVATENFNEVEYSVTCPREAEMFFYSGFKDNTIVSLEGYFQNWRFASMIERHLRQSLCFKESYENISTNIFENIKNKFPEHRIVSLHFRGWDQSESSGFHKGSEINHPPVPIGFYEKACKSIADSSKEKCKYLVFSNNTDESKNAFKNSGCFKDMIFSEDFLVEPDGTSRTDNDIFSTLSAPVDLCLMSKCDGHIISNSTFSWWGAWLANGKNVIAPSRCRWFGEHLGRHNLTDLYPPHWKEIWYPPHQNSFVSIDNFTG